MKNLHLIPTDKPSRLFYNKKDSIFTIDNDFEYVIKEDWFQDYNIYITNDEEIKEGDWFITTDTNEIHKSDWIKFTFNNGKKIILTTDQNLIKDGVQAIDDEFLEWFVENPSCEWVEINRDWGYPSIIIPKEEPTEEAKQRAENYMSLKGALEPKQESLEEAAKSEAFEFKVDYKPFETDLDYGEYAEFGFEKGFIAGAKWQQETMYSEEEVLELWNWLNDGFIIRKSLPTREELIGWFEQFKKK